MARRARNTWLRYVRSSRGRPRSSPIEEPPGVRTHTKHSLFAGIGALLIAGLARADVSERAQRSGDSRQGRVVLRAAGSPRVLIRGGVFGMGSDIPEVALAQAMCRLEPLERECEATSF